MIQKKYETFYHYNIYIYIYIYIFQTYIKGINLYKKAIIKECACYILLFYRTNLSQLTILLTKPIVFFENIF